MGVLRDDGLPPLRELTIVLIQEQEMVLIGQ